ncbi:glycosyltransferase family 2 protein [Desulfobacterota bacterium M19]
MHLHNKKVSILIPVYNREELIEETIQSALGQTYENIEIIIIDNKSSDKTWEILQSYSIQDDRIKIFPNNTNIGPVRNWERCIAEASGEYGKILWSDDLIAPNFLEKTLPHLKDDDIGFVITGTEIFEDESNQRKLCYFIGDTGVYTTEKYINGVLFEGNYPVSPSCALFRTRDLKQNLLVDVPNKVGSDFSMHAIGNDLLIFLLTAHKYKSFAHVNEKLSYFRLHKGSISIKSKSTNGKLPLHYNLASAYFVENYRTDLIKKQNVILWNVLRRYSKTARLFNLKQLTDFYTKNENKRFDYILLIKKIIKKLISAPQRRGGTL